MSVLQMLSCDGCGATGGEYDKMFRELRPPVEWFEVLGPATVDEVPRHRVESKRRHACSPACLAKLGEHLAKLPDAIQPGQTVDVDEYDD